MCLNHWDLVTHTCVCKLAIIGSDNGQSPGPRQAIIWTNAGILLIGTLVTNFSEILIKIHTFSLKEMHLKPLFAKSWPFCLGLNVLTVFVRQPLHSANVISFFTVSDLNCYLSLFLSYLTWPSVLVHGDNMGGRWLWISFTLPDS